jgi:Tfp pilus assembly protein PilX
VIKKTLASKKGASSILVILLMVVLIVFGIAALTTALSNMRLGQKVADRTSAYYTAEGIASERFATIDKAVAHTDASLSSVKSGLSALGFDTDITCDDNVILIAYETWSGDVGICAVLAMTEGNPGSLHITEWIQKTERQAD